MFLAISTFSMALSHTDQLSKYASYLYFLSTLCIVLAARMCDWMLDTVSCESWAKIKGVKYDDKFMMEFERWDSIRFRVGIYSNVYFIFALIISFVAFIGVYWLIGSFDSKSHAVFMMVAKFALGFLMFIYVNYQMLTFNSRHASKFIIFIACSVVAVFAISKL